MAAETSTIRCHSCAAERDTRLTQTGDLRLPRGWKRLNSEPVCEKCWNARFVLRAVTIPIARPVNGTWEELREVLNQCWAASTALANWTVRELSQADVVRTPAMQKLPKMRPRYLYPAAREAVPEVDPQSTVAVLQAVEKRWRSMRYDVIWRRAAAPPSYRYPTAYPINNQAWSAEIDEGGALILSARLGGERRRLRLRGGSGFWRQRRALEALIRGEAYKSELAIYQRGGDIMAKMVMWLPRNKPGGSEKRGTLYLRTAVDALLEYWAEDEEPRRIHADHVRRWAAQHRHHLERTSHDMKRELRVPKKNLNQIRGRRQQWARKYRDRMDSMTHEVSAMIAGYASRRRVATVEYDDRDRSYLEDFPWARLRELLAEKLDAAEIEFEFAKDKEAGNPS